MTNTQTHKNPRDLTQRVLLLALFDCILALRTSTANRNATNSIDETDMKQAGQLCPIYAQIQTIAPAINPLCRLFILKKMDN